MKRGIKKKFNGLVVSTLAFGLLASPLGGITASAAENQPTNVLSDEAFVKFKIMETTDIHGSIMDHDYYSDVPVTNGLVRLSTVVKGERQENPNNLLIDNGDMLQGNPFTDYVAKIDRPTFVNRLEGSTRYETAVKISKQGWDSADTVIIVRGDDFADALTAAPLAYKLNAPILLTQSNELNADTTKEIKRLGATRAIIIGGKSAISNHVSNVLSSKLNLWVKRLSGATRFETATAVAAELGSDLKKAVLVNGRNYPDAISAASYAAKNGLPILLTESNAVPSETSEALKDVTDTILIGGTAAIGEAVEKSVKNPHRIGGETRFETSYKIATELDQVQDKVFIATGRNFADALAGSVLAAKEGAPILLTEKDALSTDVENLVQNKYVTVLGGTDAVSDRAITGETHPIYDAMNMLNYDVSNFGNHEFNYGLDFLTNSIRGAEFPFVSGNIYKDDHDNDPTNNKSLTNPYKIIKKEVVDKNGETHNIKVGVIGFAPPQIMQWDKQNLDGKVVTEDIVASAKKWIPEMKEKGADLVVVVAHSGFTTDRNDTENAILGLSEVPNVDAILLGHSHLALPGDTSYNNYPGIVDNTKGTINGVPAVQAKVDGQYLGVIDLDLDFVDGKWQVKNSQSEVLAAASAVADPEMVKLMEPAHEETVAYINGPVGETTAPINSFFARVQDDPSVQIVNNAQKEYMEKSLKGTEYEGIPVLSAAAPFKYGRNGVNEFTNIAAGQLTIKNVADLYKFSNTVSAKLLTGAQLKDYLEWTATNFNQIDPSKPEEQELLNPSFPGYNFDVVDGITYEVDVTQPARYDAEGKAVANPTANRIKNIKFNGQPVTDDMKFVLATNNYRASNPIVGGQNIYSSADENRQVVMNYIINNKVINPAADQNWKISPIEGDANVTFQSSPAAKEFANQSDSIKYVETLQSGFAKYKVDYAKNNYALSIMHTNDTHANIDNVAKKMTAINSVRATKPNALLLDAGDVFSGTLYFNEYKGLADLKFMELAGYDAMTFGNHEFDLGTGVLADFVKEADFPFVSANVNFTNDANLKSRFHNDMTTDNPAGGEIYNGIIKEVNGEKIGIFGLTTAETPTISSPGEGVVFENYIEEAQKSVDALKAQGVNKIIALSHIGYDDSLAWDNDLELAKQVEGIDVIVGGHTHTKLDAPVFEKTGVEPTVIVQANEYNKYLGTLDVTFDEEGKVIEPETTGKLLDIATFTEDPATAQILNTDYKPAVDQKKATVVGTAGVELLGGNPPARTGETNLGNFVADGMLAKAKTINPDTLIAFQNGGGVRVTLPAGNITLADVFKVLPFGNTLGIMDLKGDEIKAALEYSVKDAPTAFGGFLQVSGLKFTFDSSKPVGSKVQTIEVKGEDGNYTALDLTKNYYVATNIFTAKGGDGFTMFAKAYAEGRVSEPGFVDWEMFNDYIAAQPNKTVNAQVEGRIVNIAN